MTNPNQQWSAEDRSRIEAALRKVLEGRSFSAAPRLQNLLRYLVTETLAGRGERLNQSSIAIDVQGKDAQFDPATDSQVRVEAGRLRAKLREYYEEEGRTDDVRFELPKGDYKPRFRFAGEAEAVPPLPRPSPARGEGRNSETPSRRAGEGRNSEAAYRNGGEGRNSEAAYRSGGEGRNSESPSRRAGEGRTSQPPLSENAFLPPQSLHLPEGAFLPPAASGSSLGGRVDPSGPTEKRPYINEHDESIFPSHPRLRVAFVATIAISLLAAIAFVIQQKPEDELVSAADAVVSKAGDIITKPLFTGAKSLAVLPFQNSSAAQENAGFFADGLHDDLLTQLTKIADLKVISRTSVMGYRDAPKPIRQIAEELGVHAVLEGAVQRVGDRVRVNVQLIDGRTDEHIWAESFDQELNATNIFEIQRRIATQIAAALQATLSPQEASRLAVLPTTNFEAYELYLKGRQQLTRRTLDDMAAATGLFNESLAKDPEFALAYVGQAESAYLRNVYGGLGQTEMMAIARPALARAFALNDQIGEAWTVEGAIRVLEENPLGAEEAFKRAIALNPNYAQAYHWYGSLLGEAGGRRDEALKLAQRARELDPLSPLLRANLADSLEDQGRIDEALAELKAAVELDPEFQVASNALAYHYLGARADIPTAMQLLGPAVGKGPNMDAVAGIAYGYHILGEMPAAAKWTERYITEVADPALRAMQLAIVENAQGDHEHAVAHAQEGVQDNGKYINTFRPLLLSILRNADLRAGRPADAKARYLATYPELGASPPQLDNPNLQAAIDYAYVLQKLGENDRAAQLLDGAATVIQGRTRLGKHGYGIADVQIAALRGDRAGAIAALRRAVNEGWLFYWWELPDRDPNLNLLHGDPEYTVLMKTIQAKLAAQSLKVRALEKSGVVPVL